MIRTTIGISLLIAVVLPLSMAAATSEPPLVQRKLDTGEAVVWYLGHSGWAVKTKSHLLIFDYWEYGKRPDLPSLAKGFVAPEELKELSVIVFATHVHRDHFDQRILGWRDQFEEIRYVLGWKVSANPADVEFGEQREIKQVGEATIANVYNHFDDCPENSYLVQVDGLTILHNGDHENWGGKHSEPFEDNLSYLAGISDSLDIAFVPCFDRQRRVIELLKPRFTFPMHEQDGEHRYKRFAAANADLRTEFVCAESRGQAFLVKKGGVEEAR